MTQVAQPLKIHITVKVGYDFSFPYERTPAVHICAYDIIGDLFDTPGVPCIHRLGQAAPT
jgi:hypothetical protein